MQNSPIIIFIAATILGLGGSCLIMLFAWMAMDLMIGLRVQWKRLMSKKEWYE